MPKKKKPNDDEIQKAAEDLTSFFVLSDAADSERNKIRIVSLYGDINEEKAESAALTLMALKESGAQKIYKNPEDINSKIESVVYQPIEVYISTWGGSAADMFAIYDTVRMVREDCNVLTIGMGKVMSAGVLLLAAGTKGKRKIGRNCRIMLHSVIGGNQGPLHNLENEMEEIRWTQKTHIDSLVKETNMTKKYLEKLLDRRVNAYISAAEAVELGIADIII